ncbi:TonB-dependent receptor [Pedobacter sp. BMA]|uniref:TonB-dependent receptor n=1 Tax=Pedobacter sp. BMA TaxID=1663685 RepID=UPI000649690E|nr:carboxypeptidase regulatory-like domain-containing protein [Pedobacter sp. BMA]KLT67208.1 hypothetical protein AB669_00295 [Pedobacter sp. BMA]
MRTLIILLLLLNLSVLAQTTRTSLSGRVTNDQGFAIAVATITLKDLSKGTTYGCVSNQQGGYQISGIIPGGPYRLEASSPGLLPFLRAELYFSLAQPQEINIVLESAPIILADINIAVLKKAASKSSMQAAHGIQIPQDKIRMLPSLKRSIADFIRLDPRANGAAIAGGNYRQNFITVDGSEFNNNFGVGDNLPGNGAQPISLDAIAEIYLNNAPYDAIWESGFIGSAVNIISRSGSNTLQGSAYSFLRESAGNVSLATVGNHGRTGISYALNGFRLGGAIKKDKLFYFISLERETEVYPPQIYHAATSDMPYGSAADIARPNASELDQISNYLSTQYGYHTGAYQDYDFKPASNRLLGRLDWNIAENNTLSLRYNQLMSNRPELVNGSRSPLTPFSSSAGRRGINALPFSNSNFDTKSIFYSLSAEWDYRLSSTVNNALRASFTRQHEYRVSDSRPFPFVDILKDGLPFTSFGYEPFSMNNKRLVSLYSVSDILRWKPGRNSWIIGFQADYMQTQNSYMPFASGYYTFASWQDFVSGNKPVDYALTFVPEGMDNDPSYAFDYLNLSAFAQHTIHGGERLQLDLGARGDMALYPRNLASNPAVSSLAYAEGERINTAFLPSPALLLSPRLSLRYAVSADGAIVMKAGTGIFTGRIPFVWVISQARYSGVNQISQTWQGQQNTPVSFDPYPRQLSVSKGIHVIPAVVSVLSRDFKMPQSWKSTLSLEMKLPGGLKGKFELTFNRDIRGISFRDLNLVKPLTLNISGYPDHRLVYPQRNNLKYINPLNAKGERDASGNSAMSVVSISNSSKGYYSSALFTLTRKFSSGLDISISYVKSKAKNYNDGDGDQTLSALNSTPSVNGINDLPLADAGFVMPHRIVSALTMPIELARRIRLDLGLFYQGSSDGRFSYTYGRDLTGDGANRSLIYIPKNPSEINFSPIRASGTNSAIVFSAIDQQKAFFSYISQDKYLSRRAGEYAERNGALMPWRHQFDLKVSLNLLLKGSAREHSLTISADVLNLGNLLNADWGVRKLVNASSILIPVNLDQVSANGTAPSFQFATIAGKLVESTFRKDNSVNSGYLIQLGLRYSF